MSPILTVQELKEWDSVTIHQHYQGNSWALMEKAATACASWILDNIDEEDFLIICGKGNNGGDGLAIARILLQEGKKVKVCLTNELDHFSKDAKENYNLLHQVDKDVFCTINEVINEVDVYQNYVIIDAVFGYSFKGALPEQILKLFDHFNTHQAVKIAIDLPSGLSPESDVNSSKVIKAFNADITLTFQVYKQSLLLPEYSSFFGKVIVLDIGLDAEWLVHHSFERFIINKNFIQDIFQPRKEFSHKGNYGNALIIGGSKGMIGAVSLAALACLRCGAGITSALVPECGYTIFQGLVPEAICYTAGQDFLVENDVLETCLTTKNAIGIGPGIGQNEMTKKLLFSILKEENNFVIDADALNILSDTNNWQKSIPPNAILTPHPKEFDRMFGQSKSTLERIEKAKNFTKEKDTVIVLKGHRTAILSQGKVYFNITGNSSLAKGGSGDVLLGMITAFLAQGYSNLNACILSVYLHGLSADNLVKTKAKESIIARDIIDEISHAMF